MDGSIDDVVKGWRAAPSYTESNTAAGPAGAVELTEDDLEWVAGGTIIVFLCTRPGPVTTLGCTSTNPADCEA